MKKVMTAAFALSALFAESGKTHAEVNYPWCIMGDTRGFECVFSSREQCMQDGRNRGFGGQCIQNPYYKAGPPTVSGPVKKRTVSQTARPPQAVSAYSDYYTGSDYYKNFNLYWRDCARELCTKGCNGLGLSDPAGISASFARPAMRACVARKAKLASKTSGG
jgi:hypothetical protein